MTDSNPSLTPEALPPVAGSLPRGVHHRPGFGGVGVQLYRITGSCRGDMESLCGYGPTLEAALKNGGHLSEENAKNAGDPLDALFAGLSPLPAHLRDDASFLQCSKCGRKSWGGDAVNSTCGMTAPSGAKCDGILLGQNASVEARQK